MFIFNDAAATEIYTLSLHDALPIFELLVVREVEERFEVGGLGRGGRLGLALLPLLPADRKSTRLNSSHANISYAVFCLKKKKTDPNSITCRAFYHDFRRLTIIHQNC